MSDDGIIKGKQEVHAYELGYQDARKMAGAILRDLVASCPHCSVGGCQPCLLALADELEGVSR